MAQLYINLPVTDLTESVQFYTALGFVQNQEFSDDDASAMVYDDTLSVMLLTHGFYQRFVPEGRVIADTHKTVGVLNALQLDSKEAVDIFYEKAMNAGGKKTIDTYDYGFMYGRDFEDPDGHIWEVFWMDITQMPKE